jgi:hypothetical protein
MQDEGADFEAFIAGRNAHIQALSLFYAAKAPFTPFRPVPALMDRIDALSEDFGDRVGIHIRRTDHKTARALSPTELFIDEIRRIISQSHDQRFYLATDDPAEADRLLGLFPGRILTRKARSYDRTDIVALEDAIVELFSLARTSRIIGSAASTFTEAAGKIGKVPVTVVAKDADRDRT